MVWPTQTNWRHVFDRKNVGGVGGTEQMLRALCMLGSAAPVIVWPQLENYPSRMLCDLKWNYD